MTVDPKSLRRGIYRYPNPTPMEADAQVEDVHGGVSMPMPESIYRERGYDPPFDQLPLRDDYIAAKSEADDA